MMSKGPDIAIMLAKRGKEGGGPKRDEIYATMAEDIIAAVKDDDPETLASILRAFSAECSAGSDE